ncbi:MULTISPECIES: amino acid adenylation domain-containing protein [Actinosynnema]|uniref:amino acid adenylation domain-containing protein n=1 Tax=Actinosynnema TaxID=40566 RepID=UPI0020A5AC6F|nr:amino acid adenylation domain-containing protein [Actinosynnema pretiosum]MCP2097794.1 amino acid adenylation domain-containing protein [Actinosynnema pretiosum]
MSEDEHRQFHAVVNHEGQHSTWPADRVLPSGWRVGAMTGTRQQCLDHVDRVWTDLRPLSLRAPGARSAQVDGEPRTVVDLFTREARLRPERPAVRTADRTWTYAEFDLLTARLANRLRRAGAGPDSVVGLLAPKGVAALTAVVAVLRSGAACLPLDPADPPRRNSEVLADAGCAHVLVDSPVEWWPDAQAIDDPALVGEDAAPPPGPLPLDLAYAITTSGSTGRPKVVGVPHEGLVNLVRASAAELDLIRPDDVLLWTTAPTVDSSMHDVLMALAVGACVAIPEAGDLPASRVLSSARGLGVTVLEIPAAVLGPYGRSLLPRLAEAGVRLVITGGSQLDGPGLADAPPLVVANGYGPTEASVAATWYRCGADTPRWAPIGRPVRNVRAYVLDEDLAPVPDGADGQMFIAGVGLARGYLGQPARTAAVFLPDPFTDEPGARMYATGDRVRLQPDGDYRYLGRMDDQVKVRGFRVEIGEVEHALRECAGVVDAAALLREDAPGGAAIVAYLAGGPCPDEVVVEQLRQLLPGHMIPTHFRWLDALPLNRPGKVDRAALAALPVVDPALRA